MLQFVFNHKMGFYSEEAGALILRGHTDVIHDLRFVSKSEILLSVSSDNDMRAWRMNDYTCAAVYTYENYFEYLLS